MLIPGWESKQHKINVGHGLYQHMHHFKYTTATVTSSWDTTMNNKNSQLQASKVTLATATK